MPNLDVEVLQSGVRQCRHVLPLASWPRIPYEARAGSPRVRCAPRMRGIDDEGKVQFLLSHAHSKARGALDVDEYQSEQIGNDVLIAVSPPDERGEPRYQLSRKDGPPVPVLRYTDESELGGIISAVRGHRMQSFPIQIVFTAHLALRPPHDGAGREGTRMDSKIPHRG